MSSASAALKEGQPDRLGSLVGDRDAGPDASATYDLSAVLQGFEPPQQDVDHVSLEGTSRKTDPWPGW